MKYVVLLFGLAIFAGLAYLISNNPQLKVFLPKGIPDLTQKITCTGKDERLEIAQTGKQWCRKLLPDAGQPCSSSNDCMSGYCVTNIPKASSGKCYESKTSDYCLWGKTIKEAKKVEKGTIITPCAN